MKYPPFELIAMGRRRFQCLAYTSVWYPAKPEQRTVSCGLYVTQARKIHQYWVILHDEAGLFIRNFPIGFMRQGIASALLRVAVHYDTPPSAWRLIPIPNDCRILPSYMAQRSCLVDVIWLYRMTCGMGVFPDKEPTFRVRDSHRYFKLGMNPSEDREFEAAILKYADTPKNEPNEALEPTIMAVTDCAPSSTLRASHDRGSV